MVCSICYRLDSNNKTEVTINTDEPVVPLCSACPEENAVYYVFCAEQIGVSVEYTSQLCITGILISVLYNFLVYDQIS